MPFFFCWSFVNQPLVSRSMIWLIWSAVFTSRVILTFLGFSEWSGTTGKWSFPCLHIFIYFSLQYFFMSTCCFYRAMSTLHAIFITAASLYMVFLSDLYSDRYFGFITFRSSTISTFCLGVSAISAYIWVGYYHSVGNFVICCRC